MPDFLGDLASKLSVICANFLVKIKSMQHSQALNLFSVETNIYNSYNIPVSPPAKIHVRA